MLRLFVDIVRADRSSDLVSADGCAGVRIFYADIGCRFISFHYLAVLYCGSSFDRLELRVRYALSVSLQTFTIRCAHGFIWTCTKML